jgi:hypothetical protein
MEPISGKTRKGEKKVGERMVLREGALALNHLPVEGEQRVPRRIARDVPRKAQEAVANRLTGRGEAQRPDFGVKGAALLAGRDDGLFPMRVEWMPLRRHGNAARLAKDRQAVRIGAKRVKQGDRIA